MGEELHLIVNVAAAVAVALAGGLLAHWLKQSVIVGYLLAGIAIGPFTPGFIGDRGGIAALAEVGVIFLMFALGIEFSLKELARVRAVALVGTAVQVLLLIAAGLGLGALLGWSPGQGLFFGGIIAISSTMVILKTLLDRGEVTSPHGRVLLGMLVVQDLAVVILVVLLPKLAAGSSDGLYDLGLTLVKAVAFVAAIVFLGTRVVPRFMHMVERLGSPELFLLAAVAIALGTATASAQLGLSAALGAFLAGLMLTETELDHRVVAEVVPMRNLFATLFFVSVGMLIDPAFVISNLPAILGLTLFIVVSKGLITLLAVAPFRLGSKTAVFTSLGMIQTGEFSYVLARAGRKAEVVTETLNGLVLASSVLTIILTPAAFWVAPRVDLLLSRLPLIGRALSARSEQLCAETLPGDHAVVLGYGRVGHYVADGLSRMRVPVVVVEQDLHLVQGLRAQGLPAIYGDASYQSVLSAARPDQARLIVVALSDSGATRAAVVNARRANPHVPILVRLVRTEDEEVLRRTGATAVIAPEVAGA
ncbi:MAG: cation:proton antiporter, partial [Chloroflexota bacterium]|nr:cation:proton antiporter [Chloroflexota bacterium]